MDKRMTLYLCFSGLVTAAVVMLISALILQGRPLFMEAMLWQSGIFILFVLLTGPVFVEKWPSLSRSCLWLLVPMIYGLSYRIHLEFFFIYTIIWMACAPAVLSRRHCWWMLVVLNLLWFCLRRWVWTDDNPLIESLLVGTFHIFALLSALAAKESSEANEKTQILNRELLATQHLLGEASRESERTRIARDLHDLLGHHLTALTINLQVASRLSDGESKDKIEQCHALSKLLLSDVREAVSALRDRPVVDLTELLEIAIRDIPRLDIELVMQNDIKLDDVNTAEVLLRCVQESITNTLKHTDANKARIDVVLANEQINLYYSDNGEGREQLDIGNGLRGMRERLERLGGALVLNSHPSMSIHATAPLNN